MKFDILVKILLLGDSGVGKTSLMLRYADDKFASSLISTAGVDYKTSYLECAGKTIKCQLWDTAGQERFHVITQAYYKSAHGIALIYDVSQQSEESFRNVRYWMENINKHANPHCLRMLIGNKCDVKSRKIETARGKALADEFNMLFFECSAKDGTNVKEAFHTVAREAATKLNATGSDGSNVPVKQMGNGKDKKECTIQ
jgi:Ras-related protein Rab-8A